MESVVGFFIVYALVFRLAIISAGIIAIVLGYKLFIQNDKTDQSTAGASVNAQAGQVKLSLKNAGTGSVFALFGAGIIIVMLVQGNPELLIKNIPQLQNSTPSHELTQTTIQLKGRNFEQVYEEGIQQQQAGNIEAAEKAYLKALSDTSQIPLDKAAAIFNELAWIYSKQNQLDEAFALASVATMVDTEEAAYFDTLAVVLLEQGKINLAIQAAKRAVSLEPMNQDHRETLQRIHAVQGTEQ